MLEAIGAIILGVLIFWGFIIGLAVASVAWAMIINIFEAILDQE